MLCHPRETRREHTLRQNFYWKGLYATVHKVCKNCQNQDTLNISELYGYDDKDLPDSAYPICYHDIVKAQETDAKLQQKLV